MSLLSLIILLIFVGVALYLIGLIPMDGVVKRCIQVLVLLVVVLWVLEAVGVLTGLGRIRIG